ncbi:MAG: site-specific integrase [Methanomicrobiales archaeon]
MSTKEQTSPEYFSAIRSEYQDHSIDAGIASGLLTSQDAVLVREFLNERRSCANISTGRANKITYTLVGWRRFIGPFSGLAVLDIYAGIDALKRGKSHRGKPFKQNTLLDHVAILKQFIIWMIENNYSTIPEKKVHSIRNPKKNTLTKTAGDMLTPEEVLAILKACSRSADRAMISMLYEGGFRIGEVATLTWGALKFDERGVIVNLEFKTGIPRYVRLIANTELIKQWRADYPGTPMGSSLVFLNAIGQAFTHATITKRLHRITEKAGITKHITPHIFRHSRITHLILKGTNESVIKMMMWGSVSTNMFKTYAHLTGNDIDQEMLRVYGIKEPDNKPKLSNIDPIQCPHCAAINPPTTMTCYTCGEPLDPTGVMKLEEMAKYIVQHGDSLKRYIDSLASGKNSPI